jgi:hypothetical protein
MAIVCRANERFTTVIFTSYNFFSSTQPQQLLKFTVTTKARSRATSTTSPQTQFYLALISAYTFSAKVLDITCQNAVVTAFVAAIKTANCLPGPESVNLVFDRYIAGSSLCRLVTDSIAYCAHADGGGVVGWDACIEGYDKVVLVDAMKVMMVLRERPSTEQRPYYVDANTYHEKEGSSIWMRGLDALML